MLYKIWENRRILLRKKNWSKIVFMFSFFGLYLMQTFNFGLLHLSIRFEQREKHIKKNFRLEIENDKNVTNIHVCSSYKM